MIKGSFWILLDLIGVILITYNVIVKDGTEQLLWLVIAMLFSINLTLRSVLDVLREKSVSRY